MATTPDPQVAALILAVLWCAELGVSLRPEQLRFAASEPPRVRRADPHATLPGEIITRQ